MKSVQQQNLYLDFMASMDNTYVFTQGFGLEQSSVYV